MESGRFDVTVIGGGIVGLATALAISEALPRLRLAVLEKENRLAAHQTGHNSGVIHSGIYYVPGSRKAKLCVEGARLLCRFCDESGVAIRRTGKVIVAVSQDELPRLETLHQRGAANGVAGLRRLAPEELRELEPHARGLAALHSPETCTVDFREVAEKIAGKLEQRGVAVRTEARLVGVSGAPGALELRTPLTVFRSKWMVNCAGLYSDVVAALSGACPAARIVPFRGEYYRLRPDRRHLVRGLIYPVPDPRFPFLGVHFTRGVGGEVEAGPNAVLAFAREGYRLGRISLGETASTLAFRGFWAMVRRNWRTGGGEMLRSLSKSAFTRALQRLVPEIRQEDLAPGGSGVRAQAVDPDGSLVDDFRIVSSPGALHVLNAPSPAATAALAIGRELARRAEEAFGLAKS
ncbi:MAG TPA: L-2-hydroxyglutarate oxidase [Candidatus Polarisedimenticolia bacterium]|jgi:L-2-hydroxyglutarate oxidase LhgO|nr:L-2-hydroxyglutarate oxidase [Candidatus Polarisedimenticolia bacterium]